LSKESNTGCAQVIIAIALIVLAIQSAITVISVAIASSLAWGSGVTVGLIMFYASRKRLITSLRQPGKVSELVTLTFDGNRLNCSVNEAKVEKYSASSRPLALGITASTVTTLTFLWFLAQETDAFVGHKFFETKMSVLASTIVAGIISTIIISYTFVKVKAKTNLRQSIRQEVGRWVSSANVSLESTSELQSIVQSIAGLASKLNINFPDEWNPKIAAYVENNKPALLINTSGLNKLLRKQVSDARDVLNKLEHAIQIYTDVKQVYLQTAHEATQRHATTILQMLDEYSMQLESSKNWLLTREWNKFMAVVTAIKDDLENLYNIAINYQETSESNIEEQSSMNAYDILGVSPEMTDEEIHQVYIQLVKIYHEGTGFVKNEKKWKEINVAYQQIMEERKGKNG